MVEWLERVEEGCVWLVVVLSTLEMYAGRKMYGNGLVVRMVILLITLEIGV
jgi:hypothetical protein